VRKPDHITSVLPAADWQLDEQTRSEIEEAMVGKELAQVS
jgi:hypothetical protein